MSPKDYVRIAVALKSAQPDSTPSPTRPGLARLREGQLGGWERAVQAVAAALADDNPRFDKGRFLNLAYHGEPTPDNATRKLRRSLLIDDWVDEEKRH